LRSRRVGDGPSRLRSEEVVPDPNSVLVMSAIDGMRPEMRALVREFGFTIVADMISEGYTTAKELRPVLETWRERRQEQWLATNYIVPRRAFG
jgi:hypothetical protein